jgi:hypothetical protein
LRWDLKKWWETKKLAKKKNGGKILMLKQHLDMYHMFTGIEHKGTCKMPAKATTEGNCMGWIVGLKFVQNSNDLLREELWQELVDTLKKQTSAKSLQPIYAINKTELDKR